MGAVSYLKVVIPAKAGIQDIGWPFFLRPSLPRKEKQDGGGPFGDKECAIDQAQGHQGNRKEPRDQGDQDISDDLLLPGGNQGI